MSTILATRDQSLSEFLGLTHAPIALASSWATLRAQFAYLTLPLFQLESPELDWDFYWKRADAQTQVQLRLFGPIVISKPLVSV